jgi:hypothetical protein
MSTKTTFKRIALVAVAALGLGVLSVAPSSAATGPITIAVTQNGTAVLDSSALLGAETTTGAIFTVSSLITASDSVTVEFLETGAQPTGSDVRPLLTLLDSTTAQTGKLYTNGVIRAYSAAVADSVTVAGVIVESVSGTQQLSAKFGLYIESATASVRTAGTYNYLVIAKGYTNGVIDNARTVSQAVTITIAAAPSAAATVSVANSFARLNLAPNEDADGVDAVIASEATASATPVGYLNVAVRNATNTNFAVAEDSVTVTLTGAGILQIGSITGSSFKIAATGDQEFSILPDGRAGVGTISVSTNGATYSPKTVTFYAKAAKTITATVEYPVLAVGANTEAVSVSAVDASGINWTGRAYIVASSAADALVAGSTTPVACAVWNSTDGILCPVTAIAAGTAKLKVIDASTVALATATSNEITVTSSSASAASVKIAFDKAEYQPFEKATISVTPVSATGAAISARTLANLFATGGITSTIGFSAGSDTLTAVSVETDPTTGSLEYTVYMPAGDGDVVISATGGTSLPGAGQVKVSATATVANASSGAATAAAEEATAAANDATDAALSAAEAAEAATAMAQEAVDAVAELSAQVTTLISALRKQITTLTNLVVKIQKKVKA